MQRMTMKSPSIYLCLKVRTGSFGTNLKILNWFLFQESEKGSWHVPFVTSDNNEGSSKNWLCITRPSASASDDVETCANGKFCHHS